MHRGVRQVEALREPHQLQPPTLACQCHDVGICDRSPELAQVEARDAVWEGVPPGQTGPQAREGRSRSLQFAQGLAESLKVVQGRPGLLYMFE